MAVVVPRLKRAMMLPLPSNAGIRDKGALKIYGAGIISSNGETKHCLSDASEKINFDVKKILTTDFRTDILQDKYFVIESFDQLYNALPEIKRELESLL